MPVQNSKSTDLRQVETWLLESILRVTAADLRGQTQGALWTFVTYKHSFVVLQTHKSFWRHEDESERGSTSPMSTESTGLCPSMPASSSRNPISTHQSKFYFI